MCRNSGELGVFFGSRLRLVCALSPHAACSAAHQRVGTQGRCSRRNEQGVLSGRATGRRPLWRCWNTSDLCHWLWGLHVETFSCELQESCPHCLWYENQCRVLPVPTAGSFSGILYATTLSIYMQNLLLGALLQWKAELILIHMRTVKTGLI